MFNKELFLSLCKKYNVELSNTAATKIKNPTYYLCEDYGIAC